MSTVADRLSRHGLMRTELDCDRFSGIQPGANTTCGNCHPFGQSVSPLQRQTLDVVMWNACTIECMARRPCIALDPSLQLDNDNREDDDVAATSQSIEMTSSANATSEPDEGTIDDGLHTSRYSEIVVAYPVRPRLTTTVMLPLLPVCDVPCNLVTGAHPGVGCDTFGCSFCLCRGRRHAGPNSGGRSRLSVKLVVESTCMCPDRRVLRYGHVDFASKSCFSYSSKRDCRWKVCCSVIRIKHCHRPTHGSLQYVPLKGLWGLRWLAQCGVPWLMDCDVGSACLGYTCVISGAILPCFVVSDQMWHSSC